MAATKQFDRRLYKKQAKNGDRVYYEIVLDSQGNGSLGNLRSQATIGLMTKENAAKFQSLLDEIQRQDSALESARNHLFQGPEGGLDVKCEACGVPYGDHVRQPLNRTN